MPNKAAGKPKYPIDAYQEAANIIYMLRLGIFNTNYGNTHRNLSRDLVEALDIIGNNNIKGIYVGCKAPKEKERNKDEIPPTPSRSSSHYHNNGRWSIYRIRDEEDHIYHHSYLSSHSSSGNKQRKITR